MIKRNSGRKQRLRSFSAILDERLEWERQDQSASSSEWTGVGGYESLSRNQSVSINPTFMQLHLNG